MFKDVSSSKSGRKNDNISRVIIGAPQWMGGGAVTEAQQEVKS